MAQFKGPGQWRSQADDVQGDKSKVDDNLQRPTKKPDDKPRSTK